MRHQGTLVYDSARSEGGVPSLPSPATGDRSLWFQAERVSVDVLLTCRKSRLQLIHGQVLDHETGEPLTSSCVTLGSSGSSAETNEFGEFSLSTMDHRDVRTLCVDAGDGEIVCAIPDLVS